MASQQASPSATRSWGPRGRGAQSRQRRGEHASVGRGGRSRNPKRPATVRTRRVERAITRGQSLLELLVALGVILAGILGTLTLVLSSINAGRRAAEQIVAQNLAREGIELVRAVRDSNWLDPNYPTTPDTWDRDLLDTLPDPDDPTAAPLVGVGGHLGGNSGLDYAANVHGNDQTKVGLRGNAYVQPYVAGTDIDTHYSRLITFYRICWGASRNEQIVTNPNDGCLVFGAGYNQVGLKVTSEVRWPPTGVFSRKVALEERLYNWRP